MKASAWWKVNRHTQVVEVRARSEILQKCVLWRLVYISVLAVREVKDSNEWVSMKNESV